MDAAGGNTHLGEERDVEVAVDAQFAPSRVVNNRSNARPQIYDARPDKDGDHQQNDNAKKREQQLFHGVPSCQCDLTAMFIFRARLGIDPCQGGFTDKGC